jgi:hypothetical protein
VPGTTYSPSLWFLLGNWRQKAAAQALLMLRNTAANIARQMSSATNMAICDMTFTVCPVRTGRIR